jgi:hypothetical protein
MYKLLTSCRRHAASCPLIIIIKQSEGSCFVIFLPISQYTVAKSLNKELLKKFNVTCIIKNDWK